MAFTIWDNAGQNWLTQLVDAGIVPKETRRIIVDIPLEGAVKVYYECYADERIFSIDLAVTLDKENPVISVAEAAASEAEPSNTVLATTNGEDA